MSGRRRRRRPPGPDLLGRSGRIAGHAGVLCNESHAGRCVLTARAAGMTADVPAGVELPSEFDPRSGQAWTRTLETWIPIDLAGRAVLKG